MALALLYIIIIGLANIITAFSAPFQFGVFIIPAGTFLVGITFLLRDFIQERKGKKYALKLIAVATLICLAISVGTKDLLIVTIASATSFILSELIDMEIFSRYKGSFKKRVLLSGLFGGFVDSFIFVIIGLSPLFSGVLPWSAVVYGILGQFVFKFLIQLVIMQGREMVIKRAIQ